MSTLAPEKFVCSVCGTETEFMVLTSTNTFGSPDLDLRPSEMHRSTMDSWIQTCPVCGYTAEKISTKTSVTRTVLASNDYKSCKGIPFVSDLAKEFFRHYLIMLADKEPEAAFFALLHASWACDDAGDKANASLVRGKAIRIADYLLAQNDYDGKDVLSLIQADMMRRTSRFDELLEKFKSMTYTEKLQNEIIDFQKVLARRKCSKCLTVGDAENYAAKHEFPENI